MFKFNKIKIKYLNQNKRCKYKLEKRTNIKINYHNVQKKKKNFQLK